jgi:uncharacterized protein YbjT (DUF2867 family)
LDPDKGRTLGAVLDARGVFGFDAAMKVLVIGATGATGTLAVEKLLAGGDEVTAFARDPSAITRQHERLRIVKGEARDAASIAAAMEGQDAILLAFGPRSLKKDDLQEVLMRYVLAGMRKHGVRRLVNLSAWGAGDTWKTVHFVFKIFRKTLLRSMFDDKERGEKLLEASDVDYVNVRPGRLLNEPARGGVKVSPDGHGIRGSMTRADLADFMVHQIGSDVWVRKSPVIGY